MSNLSISLTYTKSVDRLHEISKGERPHNRVTISDAGLSSESRFRTAFVRARRPELIEWLNWTLALPEGAAAINAIMEFLEHSHKNKAMA